MTVFGGLSVVEIVYGLDRLDRADRLEACMPPHVPVPKPDPCPGSKRGAKKAADAIKDAVKKAAPKKTTDKATVPKKATSIISALSRGDWEKDASALEDRQQREAIRVIDARIADQLLDCRQLAEIEDRPPPGTSRGLPGIAPRTASSG